MEDKRGNALVSVETKDIPDQEVRDIREVYIMPGLRLINVHSGKMPFQRNVLPAENLQL